MSTVARQLKEVPEKSYVASAAFNADVYKYTLTQNPTTFQTTGALTANVTGATALTCPAGTILRENGKKLYPGAHNGVTTLMVGVFWNTTKTDTTTSNMLSGFIDPNSPKFAVFSADRPNYMNVLPVDPTGGLADQGAPVVTNGMISSRVVPLGVLTVAGTTLDLSTGRIFTLTLPATAVAAPVAVSPTTLLPGVVVNLLITGGTGTLTLSGNFRTNNAGIMSNSGRTLTLASGVITMSFVSDGSNLWELSRTGALI
jgi:hypothetical protein